MVKISKFEDDFMEFYRKEKRKVVVYGLGKGYLQIKGKLPYVDYFCDRNAAEKKIEGYEVLTPEKLECIKEPLYIVVTILDGSIYDEVCSVFKQMNIDAVVFHANNNIFFSEEYWSTALSYVPEGNDKKLRINLVCTDSGWILRKFADRMYEQLALLGADVKISTEPDEKSDINHHIQFAIKSPHKNDTLMISHVDSWKLFEMLKRQLDTAALGICMSKETMNNLVTFGIPRNKLCYINPAHDGLITPKKYTIGITHRTYENDLRKRISALFDILDGIDGKYFRFVIMGAGWDESVDRLRRLGFETEYYPDFEMERYIKIMQELDYYLFIGFDEGSMGYLDALSAGVGTIVTPQGFHLDNAYPIDYPCRTVKEFHDAFHELQLKKKNKIASVADWTWERYTQKHVAIWEYMLRRKPLTELYKEQLNYEDGIYSVMMYDNRIK